MVGDDDCHVRPVDSSINFFGWGTDLLWSHDIGLMKTLWPGYGKLADGAYDIDYNRGPLGGLSDYSEKTLEVFGVLAMYPMRIASCWELLPVAGGYPPRGRPGRQLEIDQRVTPRPAPLPSGCPGAESKRMSARPAACEPIPGSLGVTEIPS